MRHAIRGTDRRPPLDFACAMLLRPIREMIPSISGSSTVRSRMLYCAETRAISWLAEISSRLNRSQCRCPSRLTCSAPSTTSGASGSVGLQITTRVRSRGHQE